MIIASTFDFRNFSWCPWSEIHTNYLFRKIFFNFVPRIHLQFYYKSTSWRWVFAVSGFYAIRWHFDNHFFGSILNCDGETHDLEQGKMPRKKIGQFENRFIQLLKLAPCELSFHYLPLKMTSKLSFVSIHSHSFCPQCHFFLDILIIDKCSSSLNCWLSTKSRINWRVCHLEPNFFCPNLFQ